jgi:hypothetical protein
MSEPLTLTDVIHKARHQYEGEEPRHIFCGDIAQEVERWLAARVASSDGLREALAEAEGVLTDGWALRLTSRPTAGYRAEALYNDKVKVYVVAATPDGALRELSDVITESHIND